MLKALLTILIFTLAIFAADTPTKLGPFEGHIDVGSVLHPGSAAYDAAHQVFTIAGSGENMWSSTDAFHFVWKKVSGDVAIGADIAFIGAGVNEHRKAVVVVRQTLDPDSPYADVALHGSGLTSLQYREAKGALTHEIQANLSAPARIPPGKAWPLRIHVARLQRPALPRWREAPRAYLARRQLTLWASASAPTIKTSSKKPSSPTWRFISSPANSPPTELKLYSTLETITIDSTDRRVPSTRTKQVRGPQLDPRRQDFDLQQQWPVENSRSGGSRKPSTPALPSAAITTTASRPTDPACHQRPSQEEHHSLVYIVPFGGTARRITKARPLTGMAGRRMERPWRSWASATTISTSTPSPPQAARKHALPRPRVSTTVRSTPRRKLHLLQLRTHRPHADLADAGDGSAQEQVTSDESNNWFPHISPDGQWMVFLTYENRSPAIRKTKTSCSASITRRSQGVGAGETLRRPGHHQRAIMVPRQQATSLRELPVGPLISCSMFACLDDQGVLRLSRFFLRWILGLHGTRVDGARV